MSIFNFPVAQAAPEAQPRSRVDVGAATRFIQHAINRAERENAHIDVATLDDHMFPQRKKGKAKAGVKFKASEGEGAAQKPQRTPQKAQRQADGAAPERGGRKKKAHSQEGGDLANVKFSVAGLSDSAATSTKGRGGAVRARGRGRGRGGRVEEEPRAQRETAREGRGRGRGRGRERGDRGGRVRGTRAPRGGRWKKAYEEEPEEEEEEEVASLSEPEEEEEYAENAEEDFEEEGFNQYEGEELGTTALPSFKITFNTDDTQSRATVVKKKKEAKEKKEKKVAPVKTVKGTVKTKAPTKAAAVLKKPMTTATSKVVKPKRVIVKSLEEETAKKARKIPPISPELAAWDGKVVRRFTTPDGKKKVVKTIVVLRKKVKAGTATPPPQDWIASATGMPVSSLGKFLKQVELPPFQLTDSPLSSSKTTQAVMETPLSGVRMSRRLKKDLALVSPAGVSLSVLAGHDERVQQAELHAANARHEQVMTLRFSEASHIDYNADDEPILEEPAMPQTT